MPQGGDDNKKGKPGEQMNREYERQGSTTAKGRQAQVDVAVVGAGLAGMVAAYEVRNSNVLVLETLDRVGGRTLSGSHGEYWYNLGAQFVWDRRTLGICANLGIELLPADGARSSIFMKGKFVSARNPYTLFARLPLSPLERIDLARTVTRLRWLSRRLGTPAGRELDSASLLDLMGRCREVTREVIDLVALSGTGLESSAISGWIGIGYAIHLFGGNVNHTLKQVRGGTQTIAKALAEAVGPERVLLRAEVTKIKPDRDGVTISYRRGEVSEEVRAKVCIVSVTADVAAHIVEGLPATKEKALNAMAPYAPIVATAWLTDEDGPMPWDSVLVVPVIDDLSFEQFNNNSLFLRRQQGHPRHRGGALVTLSTAKRGERLWPLSDEAVRRCVGADLKLIFPSASAVLDAAEVRVQRWHALPAFRRGWLGSQDHLREPVGRVYFCGDYTAQPGTPGAVGSGYYAAQATRAALRASVSMDGE